LADVSGTVELNVIIGGSSQRPAGEAFTVVAPFDHQRELAISANADYRLDQVPH